MRWLSCARVLDRRFGGGGGAGRNVLMLHLFKCNTDNVDKNAIESHRATYVLHRVAVDSLFRFCPRAKSGTDLLSPQG